MNLKVLEAYIAACKILGAKPDLSKLDDFEKLFKEKDTK